MLSLDGYAYDGVPELRRGSHVLLALLVVIGSAACEEEGGGSTAPAMPGSISVTTETSGFMKDDSYELLVNGESEGTIGANDQVTISELDPTDYEVDLGDVAANCEGESVSVQVASEETAEVSLAVVCAPADPVSYTIDFSRERPNLDNGEVIECPFGICDSNEEWDLYVENDSQSDPSSVIRQNQTTEVEIAHLPEVTLEDLTEGDFEGATFTTDLVDEPFDAGRVILIRTDVGNVYALGNPVEDTENKELTFDAALIVEP